MRALSNLAIASAVAVLALLPASASAQYGYPPPYPGYPAYRYGAAESDLRIVVKPKDASVYVDGYFAGMVDDFDGAFQRLHVTPGQHEIVVRLEGYRSIRQTLYLSAHATRKIEGILERLSPGEPQDPVPTPVERPVMQQPDPHQRPPSRRSGSGREAPPPPPPPEQPRERPEPATAPTSAVLAIRVQPDETTVFIDGERWSGPSSADERLMIQISPGRHQVRVEKDGYDPFSTDVEANATQTLPLNVTLRRAK